MLINALLNLPVLTSHFNMQLAAGAGDPHFVGFDGEGFEYHGEKNNDYLIYEDGELRIVAKFTEPDITQWPHLANMTFMTELDINGVKVTPEMLTQMSEYDIQVKTGLVRGIPEAVGFVQGNVVGVEVIDFSKGQLIITSMDSAGLHINLTFKIDQSIEFTATGILGQTLLPKEERKSNDTFKVVKHRRILGRRVSHSSR